MYANNHCLVFSHDENSNGYSSCDTKYGDISDNSGFSDCQTPSNFATNPAPYKSICSSITNVNIENKIKPKNMGAWFDNMSNIEMLDLRNIDASNCENMYMLFHKCKKLTSINYGSKFVVPDSSNPASSKSWLFVPLAGTAIYYGMDDISIANRPEGYTRDKLINIVDTSNISSGIDIDVSKYKSYIISNNYSSSGRFRSITFYDSNNNVVQNNTGTGFAIPEGSVKMRIVVGGPSFELPTYLKVLLTDKNDIA